MIIVDLHEAKTHLSHLISGIERNGEPVLIQKHGKPVVEMISVPKGSRLRNNPKLKPIIIKGDLLQPTEKEWENV